VFSLVKLLGEHHPEANGKGWVTCKCPFALSRHKNGVDNNPSFAIKIEDNKESYYNCFSCGATGDMMDLAVGIATLYKGRPDKPDLKSIMEICAGEADDIVLTDADIPDYSEAPEAPVVDFDFPEWWLEQYPKVNTSERAMKYLSGVRGVPDSVIKALDLRWDSMRDRVGFPFRNSEGLLCGMNGRAVQSIAKLRYFQYDYEKHYNMHLWYGEEWVDYDKPVVVTESVFDLASIYRVYQNVVAAFSCSFSRGKALRLGGSFEIITMFDSGNGGDIARGKIKDYLGPLVLGQIIPEDDAGAMTLQEVTTALADYVPLNFLDKPSYPLEDTEVPWEQ